MLQNQLEAYQEAEAGGSSLGLARGRVQRPKKAGNLQAAMSLLGEPLVYRQFCVSSFFIITKCVETKLFVIARHCRICGDRRS
jgi:hypothetical protein